MYEVINDIRKEIPNNTTIVIATSGGPDSMCLLSLIIKLKKEKNFNIICAHVNHKLREESKEEAKMVKHFCTSNNITYEYSEIKKYQGNIENYARQYRYAFFEKIINKHKAKYLLTAHHGDDLIETILMKIARGSNLDGFKGFSKISNRQNYKIYRPLISVTKNEIMEYIIKKEIPYAIDKTNKEDKYTRNRFRKYIIPPLKKENKNIHKNFIKLSLTLEEYDNYINKIVNEKIKKICKDNKITINTFNKEEKIIKEKIIYTLLQKEYKEKIYLIKDTHLKSIIKLLENKKPNLIINLPSNKSFHKSYDKAYITENKKVKEYDHTLENELKLPNNHIIKIIDKTDEKSNNVIKINSKEITLPIHIRTRKKGDKMMIKGLNGSKKIKNIFIDEKVPKDKRNDYPIVTDNENKIIWIPGLKKSKFDASNTENYDIIIKYF